MEPRDVTHTAQMFDIVARQQPDARALVWTASDHCTYGELDRLSNRVAHLLLERGVRKRDTVCISLDKIPLAYATIVGCLKIGAAYFAADPSNPPARTRTMADRCRPALAITDQSAGRGAFDCQVLATDASHQLAALAGCPEDAPRLSWDIDGSDPAYIMFTSGSTGAPKGATISQNNLLHFLRWSQSHFAISPRDILTNVNPLFFDNSVFDIYSSLFAGAALVPFDAAIMREPAAIVSRIRDLGCTLYFSVPSLLVYLQTLKLIGPESFPALKKIMFGGEGYPKPMLRRLFEDVGGRIELHNVYGPTECTCICSAYRVGSVDFAGVDGYVPLGRLIPTCSYVIVDESGVEVQPGVTGELFLGGPSVGLGYYNAPELTERSFVQNPTHNRFVDRMYRTGDLVRWDPADNTLHFVGRTDTQIKHQGYRIELGEIEHALAAIEGIDEAAAIYSTAVVPSRIVAVVGSTAEVTPRRIKDALAQRLPKYMIPDRVIVVPRLPKNANGKIDRKGIEHAVERSDWRG